MEGMNVLPPGFRFHPTDEELINDFLKKKISTCSNPFVSIIAEIDLYKFNPWELPGKAYFGEKEWYFFSQRDRKYPNGARPNRAAASGYWKTTGTDKPILSRYSQCIGLKKALLFYEGRAPKCNKTNWMMYEYRLLDTNTQQHPLMPTASMKLDEWVLCRVRQKTVPEKPYKHEEVVKKKAKRANYKDTFDEFMEEECVQNISFLQKNAWQKQHYYQQSDQTLMIDFEEGTSSSHSISYDTYDSQVTTNGSMDNALEGIRRALLDEYAPHQSNKRLCSANTLANVLSNNSCNFHISPN